MALWAGWEVEQPETGRNFIREVQSRGADPATRLATSRRLVTIRKVNSLEFVFWPRETKIENDVSPGGIKQTNRNQPREMKSRNTIRLGLLLVGIIKYTILLNKVFVCFPHLVIEQILTQVYLHCSVFFIQTSNVIKAYHLDGSRKMKLL